MNIVTLEGQAFDKEFPMGLETAGGVTMQLFEYNIDIPPLKGQAVETEFPMRLETAGGVTTQLIECNLDEKYASADAASQDEADETALTLTAGKHGQANLDVKYD